MVDFRKMKDSLQGRVSERPSDIFSRLPKPDYIDDLHQSQAEVLESWYSKRNSCRDFILKLHTGGGKTLVGLLVAMSSMIELGKGALYLVENRQLVDQVVTQAEELGIPAIPYSGKGSLNGNFRNGKAILVASYAALFNGRTAFGLEGDPDPEEVSVIVFDDAHSSFDAIRDTFTLEIKYNDNPLLYAELCAPFREAFGAIDKQTTYDDFLNGIRGISNETLEVPYWAWEREYQSIASLLSKRAAEYNAESNDDTSKNLFFKWPLIKNDLKYCRAIVSKDDFSITPYLPMVDKFPTYTTSPRCLFMSATFADDGNVIRSFAPKCGGVPELISTDTLAGVGRRMIIPLKDSKFIERKLLSFMEHLADVGKGAVVLTNSFANASEWEQRGWVVPKDSASAARAVLDLRKGVMRKPVVFAHRYNGIDLPKDACRILLLDGIPKGSSSYDKLEASMLAASKMYARSTAQMVEQAIGRGTRGSGDYCVTVLADCDLINWVEDKKHQQFFSLPVRAQLECGISIIQEAEGDEDLFDAIKKGASGDQDFAEYLAESTARYVSLHTEGDDSELIAFSKAELEAFSSWRCGNGGRAIAAIDQYCNTNEGDNSLKGFLLQMKAHILYVDGNKSGAFSSQKRAHNLNSMTLKPVVLNDGIGVTVQAEKICQYIAEKRRKGNAIDQFDKDVCDLQWNKEYKLFENALKNLGLLLGFDSRREDKNGKGSDVVWLDTEQRMGVVFEAKNKKGENTPFKKEEHGQLLVSEKWFCQNFPNYSFTSVSVHPNSVAYQNSSAGETHVLTPEKLDSLLEKTRLLWVQVNETFANPGDKVEQCAALLLQSDLAIDMIPKKYFQLFRATQG